MSKDYSAWYKVGCSLCVACAVLSSAGVIAADGDVGIITFTGGVTGETCKISNSTGSQSSNMTLVMPVVAKKDVESATIENGGVGRTPFDIELSGCATGISRAQVSFSSEEFANLTDGTLNNDTTIDDAAKNVNVVLFNNGNSQSSQVFIGRQDDTPQIVTLDNGSGVFSFAAAYVLGPQFNSDSNQIVPGKVHTNATFSITYY
ncbi:fimbrial protein [Salmonella enterica]|nr:fimbrial protein [Salmonella enterica]EEJ5467491.1 fimbrial protein [Salmonella enterica subsp. diarizonae]EHJ0298050.1 fimbrial protein [Salmonella enterica subsp. diarizonae serovar 60:k:z]